MSDKNNPAPAAAPPQDENQIIAERRAKLAALRTSGQAYPNDFRRDALAAHLHDKFDDKTNEDLESLHQTVAVAGRMMLKRVMGKAAFATLQDMSGRIQLYVTLDALGAEELDAFKHWDLGDLVGATGTLFKTKTGELSVKVTAIRLLAKALRPLPEKFHGLTDQEQRYRQRYVDLITNPASRDVFVKRSQIVQAMREFFVARGYLEVETPMMHPIPGGAAARPFVTHHNALDMKLYPPHRAGALPQEARRRRNGEGVRGQPQLPQRRLLDAAQPRIHDARVLRGLSGLSLPDGSHRSARPRGRAEGGRHDLDYLSGHGDRPRQAIRSADDGGGDPQVQPAHPARPISRDRNTSGSPSTPFDVEVLRTDGLGVPQLKLFEATTEMKLVQPTFIVAYPADVSPLARASDANAAVTDRFELFMTGREFANGFSELNDPEDQAARFRSQVEAREAGDEEAMFFDADYLRAMEYGLPPTAGEGIGVDRLVMLLTDSPSIRDVILFPQLKTEG